MPATAPPPAPPPAPPIEDAPEPEPLSPSREALWRIIFLSDTKAGRAFDIALLIAIIISVVLVMVDSVESIASRHATALRVAEWVFTGLFTVELLLRLWVVRRPSRYLLSFFGVVDLLAILPSYLELFVAGTHYLMVIRVLRLLRMFRVLKLAHHLGEAGVLMAAVRASQRKVVVFLLSVCVLVCVEGTLMFLIESRYNPGFDNIPHAVYWTIVTITTVGFGDITPVTVLGKMLASLIMLTGFAIIAVPTGIVTAELGRKHEQDGRRCKECGWVGHDQRARFCHMCGTGI